MDKPYRWGDIAPPAVQRLREVRAKRGEITAWRAEIARFKARWGSRLSPPSNPPSPTL